jgi:uncharacterized Zn-finger protein
MSGGNRYHPIIGSVNVLGAQIMAEEAEIEVETATIACNGGGGALGHPNVYLHMDDDDRIVCPYCSRTFVLREGVKPAAH